MTTETATAVAKAAEALEEGAAADKRAIAAHRRSLRSRMRALAELQAQAKRAGIEITLNTKPPRRQGDAEGSNQGD